MPLTSIVITGVSPRGGVFGTTPVVVSGSGFGTAQGFVAFDPNGENVQAVIVSWAPGQVEFTVPTMNFTDRFYDVVLSVADTDDAIAFKWWVPVAVLANQVLDFQYPGVEAGTSGESLDDPTRFTAGDFNRLLDRINAADGYTPANAEDRAGAGLPQTFGEALDRIAAVVAAAHGAIP